jgi:class 3 adenylate cyclase
MTGARNQTEGLKRVRYRYPSLDDFVTANELTVDGVLDDGWGAPLSVKGRELEAAVLFADISSFTERTADLSPVETLAYVNTFFTWITAEALREGPGIIDKYIGDEVMVVFASEFGSDDPFEDAVKAGLRMCENDVLDYGPHIGIASGPVVVGYAGTPVRHTCSVFGAPVALAARCAGVAPNISEDQFVSHTLTFPTTNWAERDTTTVVEPKRYRDPSGEIHEDPSSSQRWTLTQPFDTDLKGLGDVSVQQLHDQLMRMNNFTAEDRARDAVNDLRRANRYWPEGRHPQAP